MADILIWFSHSRDFIYRLHSKWFRLSSEQFDALHYGGIALYKIGILPFNLVPLIALRTVG